MPRREHTPADTESLFRSHAPFVARFLYRLGVSADDIDDAVQEVFLVVHRTGGYVPSRAGPTTYLAAIAIRAAATARRRAAKQNGRVAELPLDDVASPSADPVSVLEEHESMRRLQLALDCLEPSLRATLVLVELEGESCASVASGMAVPIGTVYWRLHRARSLFRRAVAEISSRERESPRGGAGERGAEGLAMRWVLLGKSTAAELLRLGRAHPPVRYDVGTALVRHQALIRSGAPVPSWGAPSLGGASASAAVGVSAGLGVAGTAILAGIAALSSWNAPRAGAPPAAVLAAVAAVPRAPNAPPPPRTEPAPRATASATIPEAAVTSLPAAAPPVAPLPTALRHETPRRGPARAAAATSLATGDIGPEAPAGPATASSRRAREAVTAPGEAPAPEPPAQGADGPSEVEQVATAGKLLPRDPAAALAIVRACAARFPDGYMRVERRYIGIMALLALGRRDEAAGEAGSFLRDYPRGAYSERIRTALGQAAPSPAPSTH